MKLAHTVKINVFSKEEEDPELIKEKLKGLVPFDLEQEKIEISHRSATGFEHKKIKIFEIILRKYKHINLFLKNLNSKLNQEQKELLIRQCNSRLDKDFCFYLRLDKEKLLNNEYWITDSGDCYHIKISLATFPKNEDTAIEVLKEIFKY